MDFDLAVVGGGPAGLAAAICARQKGFSVVVLERQSGPIDKACGEGLMPRGLDALKRMGVLERIPQAECAPFTAIRYLQEDGRYVDGALPAPGGLGIRRLALSTAMTEAAREAGVELRAGTALRDHELFDDHVFLGTDQGPLQAGLLVAADGLHSPLRKAHKLERPAHGPARFGLRLHFAVAPWGPRAQAGWASRSCGKTAGSRGASATTRCWSAFPGCKRRWPARRWTRSPAAPGRCCRK